MVTKDSARTLCADLVANVRTAGATRVPVHKRNRPLISVMSDTLCWSDDDDASVNGVCLLELQFRSGREALVASGATLVMLIADPCSSVGRS